MTLTHRPPPRRRLATSGEPRRQAPPYIRVIRLPTSCSCLLLSTSMTACHTAHAILSSIFCQAPLVRSGAPFFLLIFLSSCRSGITSYTSLLVHSGAKVTTTRTTNLFFLLRLVGVSWNLDQSGELKYCLTSVRPKRKAQVDPQAIRASQTSNRRQTLKTTKGQRA